MGFLGNGEDGTAGGGGGGYGGKLGGGGVEETEVIGSVTRSGRDQIRLQEDREWRTLCKMAQESHKSPTLDYSGKGKRAVMRLGRNGGNWGIVANT